MESKQKLIDSHNEQKNKKIKKTYIDETPTVINKVLTVIPFDYSGSMNGAKFNAAINALKKEINESSSNNTFLIFPFNHEVINHKKIPMNKEQARCYVDCIPHPYGGTAIYTAVIVAAEELINILDNDSEYDPNLCIFKIITDGDNNTHDDDSENANTYIADLRSRGCVVTMLQAGYSTRAINALGIPESAALHWNDDADTLIAAINASIEASGVYRQATISGQSSAFEYTSIQRQASQAIPSNITPTDTLPVLNTEPPPLQRQTRNQDN